MMEEIDALDKRILEILQEDATVTIKEMALTLKKSVATIHDRISRLKHSGVILRTVTLVDRMKIGKELLTFTHILMKEHTIDTLTTFEREIKKFPEVLECCQMAGSFDFLLRIATKNMEAYNQFYRYKLATLSGIATVQSYFVLSQSKSNTAFELE